MKIPEFNTKGDLFSFLRKNKEMLLFERKGAYKQADALSATMYNILDNDVVSKASINPEAVNMDKFNVTVAINTTNLLDSHGDVHIPGIWGKSVKENKSIYLLQEHKMEFDKIISDTVKAKAVTMSWQELGFNYEGNTQVLLFVAEIEKDRNSYMSEQYAKGRVKNHSVGMRYVKYELAMNSDAEYDVKEKAAWDKYISKVANRADAEELGYFFAVTEAKVIEGSAVPLGSNFATPTISVGKEAEPPEGTPEEPQKRTLDASKVKSLLTNI